MAKRCDNCKPDLCLFAGGSGGGGGGSSTLAGLTDVDISNPTNGQTLVYNATSGKWENGAGGGGGLVVLQATLVDDPIGVLLTHTYAEIYAMLQNGPVAVNCPHLDDADINYVLLVTAAIYDDEYIIFGMPNMTGQGSASDQVLLTLPY